VTRPGGGELHGRAGNRTATGSDYSDMTCEPFREALSARLDGEDTGIGDVVLDRHLSGCPGCRRVAEELGDLHRLSRVRPAEPVPDLSVAILAAAGTTVAGRRARSVRSLVAEAPTRIALAVVAVVLVAISLPSLVGAGSGDNHLAAADIAFGAGLLVAAHRPDRARALVPVAAVLVTAMTVAAVADVHHGHVGAHGLGPHLLQVVGLGLLGWATWRSRGAAAPASTRMSAA
jgi:predicted anti-sigma-YlaC factor YlaD